MPNKCRYTNVFSILLFYRRFQKNKKKKKNLDENKNYIIISLMFLNTTIYDLFFINNNCSICMKHFVTVYSTIAVYKTVLIFAFFFLLNFILHL